jgi:hypothetical protein
LNLTSIKSYVNEEWWLNAWADGGLPQIQAPGRQSLNIYTCSLETRPDSDYIFGFAYLPDPNNGTVDDNKGIAYDNVVLNWYGLIPGERKCRCFMLFKHARDMTVLPLAAICGGEVCFAAPQHAIVAEFEAWDCNTRTAKV